MPSAPSTRASGARSSSVGKIVGRAAVEADGQEAALFERHKAARQVLHAHDRDQFERAGRRLGQHPGSLRTVPRRGDDGFDGKRRGAAQDRSDIVRVGDLVEHQHDAGRRQFLDVGRGQGIGLRDQALMHGIRRQAGGQRVGPHQFGLKRQRDAVFGEAAQRIFCRQEAADAARRIGQRRGDAVPAVQDDRPRTVSTPVPARTAMRRPTEGLFAAAQTRRPLGFDAIMSRILTVRQFDRKPNAREPGSAF